MAASSAIPATKAALEARLGLRAGLTGVQISYGAPHPNPAREFVWLSDADDEQRDVFIGQRNREETFRLYVVVSVLREGIDQKAATERAYALVDEIDAELDANPTIDGALGNGWARISATSLTERHGVRGTTAREAQVTVEITCKARLT